PCRAERRNNGRPQLHHAGSRAAPGRGRCGRTRAPGGRAQGGGAAGRRGGGLEAARRLGLGGRSRAPVARAPAAPEALPDLAAGEGGEGRGERTRTPGGRALGGGGLEPRQILQQGRKEGGR